LAKQNQQRTPLFYCNRLDRIPFHPPKLTAGQWLRVGAVWTLATCSIATQGYFNRLPEAPVHQLAPCCSSGKLPLWGLCALHTPFVMGIYRV
jgi:hypothetical protein